MSFGRADNSPVYEYIFTFRHVISSGCKSCQCLEQGLDFSFLSLEAGKPGKRFAQHVFSEGFEAIGMTGPAWGLVPWSFASLLEGRAGVTPRPEFDQCVQPQAEIPAGDIAPHVANLLLPGSVDCLHVVKILFDGGTIGHCLEGRFTIITRITPPAIAVTARRLRDSLLFP